MIRFTALLRALMTAAITLNLCGCGGGNGSSITGRYGTLTFVTTTDKASYSPGETVNFTFTATNTGTSPVQVTGTGFGFATVADPVPITARIEKDGKLITSMVNNFQIPLSVTLGAGVSKTGRGSWIQQLEDNGTQAPSGAYTLTVTLDAGTINGVAVQGGDAFAAVPVPIVIH